MTYKEILPGIKLRTIQSNRFEASCVSVSFLSEASEDVAAAMTLFPRVLRRGTTKHPDMKSLAAALDDMYGARIEPISRKYGDIMAGGFVCDFVDMDGEALGVVVRLLGEVLFDPKISEDVFCEEYVDGERTNLIDEIKSEINNKLAYAFRRATECMFEGSPYSVNELGSEAAVEKINPKKLYKFYKKLISEAPCEIFFCGKFAFEEVEREILRIFKNVPRGKVLPVKSNVPISASEKCVCENMDITQASLVIGMKTEVDDIYLSKLACAIIGGGTSSKLFTNVREKKSLCYSTGATFDSFEKAMFMYAGIDPKNALVAEKAIFNEYESCVCGDITDEEISNAKKGMIDDLLTVEDALFSMEAFWLRASLLRDERTPVEAAAWVKNIDREKLNETMKSFKLSVIYLLTGLEDAKNERKLLSNA